MPKREDASSWSLFGHELSQGNNVLEVHSSAPPGGVNHANGQMWVRLDAGVIKLYIFDKDSGTWQQP